MPGTPKHLSWTQYGMYLRCQRQFWFRYVQGIKQRPVGAMQIGIYAHEAIAADLTSKRDKGAQLSTPAFLWEFEKRYKTGIEDHEIDWSGMNVGEVKDQMLGTNGKTAVTGKTRVKTQERMGLLPLVHVKHLPPLRPELIEHEFHLPVPGTDRSVLGYIDYYGEGIIRDWKLKGGRPLNQKGADADDQTTLYAAAMKAEGKKVSTVSLDCLMYGGKAPDIKTFPMKRTVKQQKRVLAEFRDFAIQLDRKGEDPVDYALAPRTIGSNDNWVCSERFCGYWSRCPRGGGNNDID